MRDLESTAKRPFFSTFRRAICIAALLTGCSDGQVDTGAHSTFSGLGVLPGDVSTQASAVSADGLVVVGNGQTAAGKSTAFRWSAQSGLISLGRFPGGTFSNARAVSADGSVVLGDGDASATARAVFRWTASTGMVRLASLGDANLCAAGGMSGDGNVLAGTCLTVNNSAFRWTAPTGMVALGQFGGGSDRTSTALAVSSQGDVIVGAGHPVLTGAVRWTSAGAADLLGKVAGDVSASALAVSRDGGVVVGYSIEPGLRSRMFRWTPAAGMTAISASTDTLFDSVASAVSGDGQVVVGGASTPGGEVALIWDAQHGLRTLEAALQQDHQSTVPGWKLQRATGISDDGRTLVGYGTNAGGQTEAWILHLPG
jgi:probable HAF family extracellular repeat protein